MAQVDFVILLGRSAITVEKRQPDYILYNFQTINVLQLLLKICIKKVQYVRLSEVSNFGSTDSTKVCSFY